MFKEKKQYLNQYSIIKARIKRYEMLGHLEPRKKEKYEKQIALAEYLREDIEEKINDMEDGRLGELLFQKYILGSTLEEIADILCYSKRHIERLHLQALEKFKL